MKKEHRQKAVPWVLLIAMIAAVLLSVNCGYSRIPYSDVIASLLNPGDPNASVILLQIRLPRIVLAVLCGMGLALSGCVLQAVTENPLADPGILGINAGAGFTVMLFLTLFPALHTSTMIFQPLFAMAGGLLAAVLGAKLRVLKTPENFNNDIGTPLTLLGLGPEHQAAVIETGMNHFGEIRYLGEMVRPDIAVISNIGDAHIEHLGSREGILKAKSEIFENLKPEGLAVLNGDDALLNTLDLPFRTVRCGRSEHCAVRVMDMADHGVAGITCTVVSPRDTYHLTIPAPGEHMAYSAAIAVAVGEELGLSTEEITRGAASYEPAGSRMRVLRLRDGRLVLDDCYNANPQSVTAALEILAKTECGRKVAVLGDMGELGDLTDQAHYNMGALAAMLGIDEVVAIGAKAEKIADGAAQSGGSVTHFATKEEAVHELTDQLGTDTAMLVKASHAMHFGWIVEQLKQAYD